MHKMILGGSINTLWWKHSPDDNWSSSTYRNARIPWHCHQCSDVTGRCSHPGSVPQYDDRPFVAHQSHQDENTIHRWREQIPTVQVCISGGLATIVAVPDIGKAVMMSEHGVGEGGRSVHIGGSAQFSHWYNTFWGWSGQWLRQFGSDCANEWSWCTHLASVTSHVAVQNATGRALIPCLGNVSTGTIQCVCTHQIDLQDRLGSHLPATYQWLVNEHQVTNAACHTDKQQMAINQWMHFSDIPKPTEHFSD